MTLVAIEALCKSVVLSFNSFVLHSSYSNVQTVPFKIAVKHTPAVIKLVNVLNLCLTRLTDCQNVAVVVWNAWAVDRTPLALADVNELVEQYLVLFVKLNILFFNNYVDLTYRFT